MLQAVPEHLEPFPRLTCAWITTTAPLPGAMPMLFLPGGEPCLEFHFFLTQRGVRGRSRSWQRMHADAVQLLYEFLGSRGALGRLTQDKTDLLLAEFEESLQHGTTLQDGTDPHALYWRGRSWAQVYRVMLAIHRYCNFLTSRGSMPLFDASAGNRVDVIWAWFAFVNRKNASLLSYLHDFKRSWESARRLPASVTWLAKTRGQGAVLPFPKVLQAKFFVEGVLTRVQRDVARGICPHVVRDALYFLLLMYGGLRRSEPLHLFLDDVQPPEAAAREATVFLYHPENGAVPYSDLKRTEYLRAKWGLVPRNRLALTDPLFAGWKSVDLSEDVRGRGQRGRVYWLTAKTGALFWQLHLLYILHVRPKSCRHPYYFVNLSGPSAGGPMTIGAANDAFERALARLGMRPDASRGLSLHAMRHAYAHALRKLRVAPEVFRICIHHRHLASQLKYRRPLPHEVNEALQEGSQRLEDDFSHFDVSEMGARWRSDPLGIFSEDVFPQCADLST